MGEYIFKPRCTDDDFELDERDRTNPVDWYGTLHGEIVRCRDCKDYRKSDATCHSLQWGNYGKGIVAEPDGFCAWGERWLDEL